MHRLREAGNLLFFSVRLAISSTLLWCSSAKSHSKDSIPAGSSYGSVTDSDARCAIVFAGQSTFWRTCAPHMLHVPLKNLPLPAQSGFLFPYSPHWLQYLSRCRFFLSDCLPLPLASFSFLSPFNLPLPLPFSFFFGRRNEDAPQQHSREMEKTRQAKIGISKVNCSVAATGDM